MDINVDKLLEIRAKLKSENVNVSVNDFITKAVAHALLECPAINSLYKNGQVKISELELFTDCPSDIFIIILNFPGDPITQG